MTADRRFRIRLGRTAAIIAAAIPLAASSVSADAPGSSLEQFTECVAESGAVFYGAHWCPYCTKQKRTFGEFADRLPYVECYEPRSRNKLDACANVGRFPTWIFSDGSVRTGALSLAAIARSTGCTAP